MQFNQDKTKHNKNVCIFDEIYCISLYFVRVGCLKMNILGLVWDG